LRSKVLKEFPLYEIYEDGTLISYARSKPYEIKWNMDNHGYLRTNIFNVHKKRTKVSQHRLVATAFIPNPYNKETVNHINGNKSDNRIENLEWLTQKENDRHSRDILGNDWVGEKHYSAQYSDEEIKRVIDKMNEGLTNKEIMKVFPDIKIGVLHDIRGEKRWGKYKIDDPHLLVKGNRPVNHYKILEIIDKINKGFSAPKISKETGVSVHTIYAIRSEDSYTEYNYLLK